MTRPSFVCISHPESPRTAAFAGAVFERCGVFPQKVTWEDAVLGRVDWAACAPQALVRVESPGRNWEVEKRLLALGADEADELDEAGTRWRRLSRDESQALVRDDGRIHPSRQWFLGFRRALNGIRDGWQGAHGREPRWFNPPEDIIVMFDKAACQERLAQAGVRVPEVIGRPGGFDELMAAMEGRGRRRVFLKLCHGSSASGAVALETGGGRLQAFSTSMMEDDGKGGGVRLYNSRRVRRYERLAEIRRLVDALCRENALAEAWVPKAGWMGKRFDVRVVVIAGRACHAVARLARGPFTNLQFGAARATMEELRDFAGEEAVAMVVGAAEAAMRCFPASLYAGVDVALEAGLRRAWVLEVNAFGDLLPGLKHEGRDTYARELDDILNQVSATG